MRWFCEHKCFKKNTNKKFENWIETCYEMCSYELVLIGKTHISTDYGMARSKKAKCPLLIHCKCQSNAEVNAPCTESIKWQ